MWEDLLMIVVGPFCIKFVGVVCGGSNFFKLLSKPTFHGKNEITTSPPHTIMLFLQTSVTLDTQLYFLTFYPPFPCAQD